MRSRQPSDEGCKVAREVAGEEEASMIKTMVRPFYGRLICDGCCDGATESSQDTEVGFDVTVDFSSG